MFNGSLNMLPTNWVIFHAFLSSVDNFQNQLFRKILSGIPSVSNSLDPDPICLHRLSADNKYGTIIM